MTDEIEVPAPPPRPVPKAGIQHAIVSNVLNMGEVLDDYPGRPPKISRCVRFFFELAARIPQEIRAADGTMHDMGEIAGKRFTISTYNITMTTGARGSLRKILTNILGKAPESMVGFKLREGLIGKPVTLNIQHKDRDDGGVIAFIKPEHIMQPMEGNTLDAVENTDPPAWYEEALKANAEKVARHRSAGQQRVADAQAAQAQTEKELGEHLGLTGGGEGEGPAEGEIGGEPLPF